MVSVSVSYSTWVRSISLTRVLRSVTALRQLPPMFESFCVPSVESVTPVSWTSVESVELSMYLAVSP
ncbi:hypothetical protein D3C75_1143090 [compost metagenome]